MIQKKNQIKTYRKQDYKGEMMLTKKELEKLAQQVVNDGYETYKDKDETSVYLGMVIGVSKLMNLIDKKGE